MPEIFISYASQDRDTARTLADRLRERGHDVWWDRTIPPGRVFDEVIQEALSAAKCVIVLWSAHSVRSNWVKVEAEEAAGTNRLVPILIENVLPPIQFKRIQAANLVGWNGDSDHPEFQNLLASIERLLRQAGNPTAGPAAVATEKSRATAGHVSKKVQAAIIGGIVGVAIVAASLILRIRDDRRADAAHQPSTERQATAPLGPETASRSAGGEAADSSQPVASTGGERINLVAPENGGQLLAAADEKWAATIDGDEKTSLWVPFYTGGTSEAVFGFKDGRPATFDTVEVLIPNSSGNNVAEFELLGGNEALDGRFQSIQVFKTRNMLIVNQRFQRFTFKPTTTRFIKFRVLKSHAELTSSALYEWRLLGTLK